MLDSHDSRLLSSPLSRRIHPWTFAFARVALVIRPGSSMGWIMTSSHLCLPEHRSNARHLSTSRKSRQLLFPPRAPVQKSYSSLAPKAPGPILRTSSLHVLPRHCPLDNAHAGNSNCHCVTAVIWRDISPCGIIFIERCRGLQRAPAARCLQEHGHRERSESPSPCRHTEP